MEKSTVESVHEAFPGQILEVSDPYGMFTLVVESSRILDILRFLKQEPGLEYTYLIDLCGIHYPDHLGAELGLIYHLQSFTTQQRIRIKAFVPLHAPRISSAVSVFPGANWMERETYDFYGIIFEGHPDLRRILNMDDMVAFPMRKEFPLEDPNRKDKNDEYFGR